MFLPGQPQHMLGADRDGRRPASRSPGSADVSTLTCARRGSAARPHRSAAASSSTTAAAADQVFRLTGAAGMDHPDTDGRGDAVQLSRSSGVRQHRQHARGSRHFGLGGA